jgi:hypothetical protein
MRSRPPGSTPGRTALPAGVAYDSGASLAPRPFEGLVEAYNRLPDLPSFLGEVEARTNQILNRRFDVGTPRLPDYRGFALHSHLEGLTPGLGKEARDERWRVLDAEPGVTPAYLLVPTYHRGELVAVRALKMLEDDADSGAFRRGHYDLAPRVGTAPGRPEMEDAPAPHEEGLFDHDTVWVSVDPADALLLQSIGLHAVSLATPTRTLGSEDGIRQLEALGALSTQRAPQKTVVVVDPGVTPDEGWGGLLRGLFEEVWHVSAAQLQYDADRTVTGLRLAEVVRASRPLGFDQGREALRVLLGRVREVGDECEAEPERLPPRAEPALDVPLPDVTGPFGPGGELDLTDPEAWAAYARRARETFPALEQPSAYPADVAAEGRPHAASPWSDGGAGQNRRPPRATGGAKASFRIGDPVDGGEIKWIAEPFVADKSFTEVQGPAKIGKSTFLAALVAAVSQGERFLGRPCASAQVVYVSEQLQAVLNRQFSGAADSLRGVEFIPFEEHRDLDLSQIVALVSRRLKRDRPCLVVLDTLFKLGKAERGKLRTAQHVDVLFDTLRPLVDTGAGVVLVRHESGSDAVSEISDAYHVFKKPKSGGATRLIEVNSRFAGIFTVEVTKTGEGFEEVMHQEGDLTQAQQPVPSTPSGSHASAPRKETSERARRSQIMDADVLGVLDRAAPLHPTIDDLLAELGGSDRKGYTEGMIRGSLKRLMKDRIVDMDPNRAGKKGDPHRFFRLRESESRSLPSPSGGEEDGE